MFKFKQQRKRKQYILQSEDHSVQIPLTFHGRSVELNSHVLNKGSYTLCTEEQKQRSHIPVMVL